MGRVEIAKKQHELESANEKAKNRLIDDHGLPNPSDTDILKCRLWEECQRQCPYTGRSICSAALFGPNPEFNIEHIVPYSRCLDNSFMNKTLCENAGNARKGNQTPAELYAGDPDRYEAVLQRAKRLPYAKFKRFAREYAGQDTDGFVSQQLNETRYIARQTKDYLQQLGCPVSAVKGGTTGLLRTAWRLNNILNDAGVKARNDHRHHAVDALVIALTDPKAVQRLTQYAQLTNDRLRIHDYPEVITDLRTKASEIIHSVVVSHKSQRKLKGPLHKETIYGVDFDADGRPIKDGRGNILVPSRKALKDMTEKADLEQIKDLSIRKLALEHFEMNDEDFKIAFHQQPTTLK